MVIYIQIQDTKKQHLINKYSFLLQARETPLSLKITFASFSQTKQESYWKYNAGILYWHKDTIEERCIRY